MNILGPIETLESFDRFYIPLPGGWEVQTKGKGSSFRICEPNGHRLNITEQPYLYELLERMAREIHEQVFLYEWEMALEMDRNRTIIFELCDAINSMTQEILPT